MAWDYIKCRIRTESISFSIKKTKKQRDYMNTLSERLVHLEERITTSPSPLELEEYDNVKSEIEQYYDQKAKGTLIRSRCKFINEYEKPSKYFLNLENVRQKKLQISALNIDGQRISNPIQILEAQKVFYSKLFSCSETDFNMTEGECNNYLDNVNIPKLSNSTKEVCDGVITMTEVEKAVQELQNNKSPGPGGLPGEFYKIFWNDISDLLLNSFHDAFNNGFLTKSQKQGVLCLIPKKGKDLTKLESWRPLSVLNTDYKILAKVLAKRLKLGLREIINPDQIGYMESRFYGENIRLIADMIDFCKLSKNPCIILLADFEKAFDKINWNFLHACLKRFGFGEIFQKWISTLYYDIESCITNNGHQSEFFKISRGIRQGCPLSALLFLLPAEIVATILRSLVNIKGIVVNNICIKLCQLADDMTLFLRDNSSVHEAIQVFEEFYRYAGLKLNKSKTIGIIVQNDGNLYEDEQLGISWTQNTFKTLGAHFSLDSEETKRLNIKEKIKIIKGILNTWQARTLTLRGKITILKSLVMPHINILASILRIDKNVVDDIDKLMLDFLWNKGHPLIAKDTLIQPIDLGGLKMVSVFDAFKTTKIMWIKRLTNSINAKWKTLSYYMMDIKKELLFNKLYFSTVESYPKSNFYRDLLQVWFDFISVRPVSLKEMLQEPLFNNDTFQIGESHICNEYLDWKQAGIELVCDIMNSDGIFMSADLSVSWHYVVTLRRGRTRTRTRPREQLLLQNYKA